MLRAMDWCVDEGEVDAPKQHKIGSIARPPKQEPAVEAETQQSGVSLWGSTGTSRPRTVLLGNDWAFRILYDSHESATARSYTWCVSIEII